jgi:hypothetical protein
MGACCQRATPEINVKDNELCNNMLCKAKCLSNCCIKPPEKHHHHKHHHHHKKEIEIEIKK